MNAGTDVGARRTILVVDDEPGATRVYARMLEGAGFDVVTAESGPEALAYADEYPSGISLGLIDLVMPDMNGRDLARRLRRQWRTMKIVFMSGYSSKEAGELAAMEPDAQFLGKPFSSAMLERKVREVLDGQRARLPLGAPALVMPNPHMRGLGRGGLERIDAEGPLRPLPDPGTMSETDRRGRRTEELDDAR